MSTTRSNHIALKLVASIAGHLIRAGYYWLREMPERREAQRLYDLETEALRLRLQNWDTRPPDSHICQVPVPDFPPIDYGGLRALDAFKIERLISHNQPTKPDYCTVPGGRYHNLN